MIRWCVADLALPMTAARDVIVARTQGASARRQVLIEPLHARPERRTRSAMNDTQSNISTVPKGQLRDGSLIDVSLYGKLSKWSRTRSPSRCSHDSRCTGLCPWWCRCHHTRRGHCTPVGTPQTSHGGGLRRRTRERTLAQPFAILSPVAKQAVCVVAAFLAVPGASSH